MKALAFDLAKRYRAYTLAAVEGLTEADFQFRPKEKAEANSIAWILWHLAEVTDWFLWGVLKQEPTFPFGHSHLNPPAKKPYPSSKQLLEYLNASHQRYLDWLGKVEIADYDAKVEIPDFTPSSWGNLLLVLPIHERAHAAQIRYFRRLLSACPTCSLPPRPAYPQIDPNALEGYFSRLKQKYRQYRGLAVRNREAYFRRYFHLCRR